jgi:hypothetical protein
MKWEDRYPLTLRPLPDDVPAAVRLRVLLTILSRAGVTERMLEQAAPTAG